MQTILAFDKINWHCYEQYQDTLREFSPEKAMEAGQIIKSSPARKVCFVDVGNVSCVLKIFYTPKLCDSIRALYQTKARLEWSYLHLLRDCDLPVAEPVAVGTRGTTSYLLVKKIADVCTLRELLLEGKQALSFEQRRRMWDKTAFVLAQLHNNKIVHRDLHFGNVVRDNQGKIYLLDLHDVTRKHFMTSRHCLQNLAMFGSSFTLCNNYGDYFYFFKQYYGYSTILQHPWRHCYHRAFLFLRHYQLRFWDKRAKRCLKKNKYFGPLSNHHGKGYYCKSSDNARKIFADPETELYRGQILKDSRSTTVTRTCCGILKRYRRKKWRNILFDFFRPSRARRAWKAGYQCQTRAVPTPISFGYLEKRIWGYLVADYLLTEDLAQGVRLGDYLQAFGHRPCDYQFIAKKKFIERLGGEVRNLHLRGLSHRDLKFNNIMVQQDKIYFIDMDGVKCPKQLTETRKIKDLSRLVRSLKTLPEITRTDLLRLLLTYLSFADHVKIKRWIYRLAILGD